MRVHDVMGTFAQHIRLPKCPQCGDMLLAPLLAEHVSEQLVRNHWVCESCGHTFRNSFKFEAVAVEDDELVS
jgi:ribosomal protein S27AE